MSRRHKKTHKRDLDAELEYATILNRQLTVAIVFATLRREAYPMLPDTIRLATPRYVEDPKL